MTPRALLNGQQQEVWRWQSDAFGHGLPNPNPDGDGRILTYNLRFPGQYYDGESGHYYNYFRDYAPSKGQYIQSDPIGLAGGMNTYGYVGGNPVGFVDPLGLDREWSEKNDDAHKSGNSNCMAFALDQIGKMLGPNQYVRQHGGNWRGWGCDSTDNGYAPGDLSKSMSSVTSGRPFYPSGGMQCGFGFTPVVILRRNPGGDGEFDFLWGDNINGTWHGKDGPAGLPETFQSLAEALKARAGAYPQKCSQLCMGDN